jgi:hypothetical protein
MADNFATPAAAPPPSLPNTPIVRTGDGQILNAPRMSPAEAAEAYAAKIAEHQARNAPPAPEAAGPEGSPEYARARLHQIQSTPTLRNKLLTGNGPITREWHELNAIVVNAGESVPSGRIETTDSVSDPDAQPRAARDALVDGLRDRGASPELTAYLDAMDKGQAEVPSEGDRTCCYESPGTAR